MVFSPFSFPLFLLFPGLPVAPDTVGRGGSGLSQLSVLGFEFSAPPDVLGRPILEMLIWRLVTLHTGGL